MKMKQDMKKVKNNSIGMGLACSKIIVNQLNGKLRLKESVKGKTIFRIEVPVEKVDKCLENSDLDARARILENKNHMVLSNYKRELQPQILEYLRPSLPSKIDYL